MTKRYEHCIFAKLDPNTGKCIAKCSQNDYVTDCLGIERETINEYRKRVESERGTN